MMETKISQIPIESSKVIESPKNTKFPYRELLGSLTYISNKTRPDISFAVNYCSRKVENPTDQDVHNLKQILKYLKGSKEKGLIYKKEKQDIELTAYCDSDYAGDSETRRSTTGYIIFLSNCPVTWCTRRQPIVALSSTEAEYIAAAECCKELLYLKSVIQELLDLTSVKVTVFIDNQSAIRLIENGVINRRSKHIDVRFKFIHEKVKNSDLMIKYCPTSEQTADIFTKVLTRIKFNYHANKIVV
nr:secreted RxLR effector protein 161-like [Maniola hyperantus]